MRASEELACKMDMESVYPQFHDHTDLFHFAIAPLNQQGPDTLSLTMAEDINSPVFRRLLAVGPSRVGGGSDYLDGVESRHVLLATALINTHGTDWGHVVEFGGGYGNFARLVLSYGVSVQSWTVVDMPYMLGLHQWFMSQFNLGISCRYVSAADFTKEKADLVIATHSLSELTLSDFTRYYEGAIAEAPYLYYAAQLSQPNPDLIVAKAAIIDKDFDAKITLLYENEQCAMTLFKHR